MNADPGPQFPIDIGLRYDFYPLTVALRGGAGFIVYALNDITIIPRAALLAGWNFGWRGIRLELEAGLPLFGGASVSVPLAL